MEQTNFLEKIKTIQVMKERVKKPGKTFFKPPNPEKGELGLLVPSGGIMEQEEVDEIAGEALEKMAKEKREPKRTKQVSMTRFKDKVIIED